MTSNSSTVNPKPARTKPEPLPVNYQPEQHLYEIGIDEAGRGPLFGPLCVAGVVLPKDPSFDTTYIRGYTVQRLFVILSLLYLLSIGLRRR